MLATRVLVLAMVALAPAAAAGPSTIVHILIDDLGFYDTAVYNPNSPTPRLHELATGGLRLDRMYAFKYCSPTRRSLMSGRFPVHISEAQAGVCDNILPLNFSIMATKLKAGGFENHFVGKGHLGYQTTDHLPIARGFDSHVGYLCGQEDYSYGNNLDKSHDCPTKPYNCVKDFWHDTHPGTDVVADIFYSTNYYAGRAQDKIRTSNASKLYVYLPLQGVHAPYSDAPAWERVPQGQFWDPVFGDMLSVVDSGIYNVTQTLKETGRWDDALVIVSSDNGGVGPGNNYPLRGLKATPWEGGTRIMSFITGGFLPSNLRGTRSSRFVHMADWYPTLLTLVGLDPTDTVDMDGIPRPIDGIDVWGMLTDPHSSAPPREWLPITGVSIIHKEQYKLITGAQSTFWYTKDNVHLPDNRTAWPCLKQDVSGCTVCSDEQPCLFDIIADPEERVNLAPQNPTLVKTMATQLGTYKVYTHVKMSPFVLNKSYDCVDDITKYWNDYSGPCCKPKAKP